MFFEEIKNFKKLKKLVDNRLKMWYSKQAVSERANYLKEHRKSLKKLEKKFLTDEKRCDKVNELSKRQKTKNLDN